MILIISIIVGISLIHNVFTGVINIRKVFSGYNANYELTKRAETMIKNGYFVLPVNKDNIFENFGKYITYIQNNNIYIHIFTLSMKLL